MLLKKDDNPKTLPFVASSDILSQLDIETMIPQGTAILLFVVKGDPIALDMMTVLWTQMIDTHAVASIKRPSHEPSIA